MYIACFFILLIYIIQPLTAYDINVDQIVIKALRFIGTLPEVATNNISAVDASALVLQYRFGLNNDDINLNIIELIEKEGYTVQEHIVKTKDGYLLKMFRLPNKGPPVFLMHGLLLSADDWVTPGPNYGLAYLLAAEGYDVWLGNARGNKHSRAHMTLEIDSPKFWDFSWDEIGRIDLPAMIDYVLKTTNKPYLKYVGHSQGATSFFVKCSEFPEYNNKISMMVALSAVAWMSHTKSPIIRLLSPLNPYLDEIIKLVRTKQFVLGSKLANRLVLHLCGNNVLSDIFCTNVIFLVCGYDYVDLNFTNLPLIYAHVPAGSSTKQLLHYGQNSGSEQFRRYDYGKQMNVLKYGSENPPRYHVENIRVPVAIFYSDDDWLANIVDVQILYTKLSNVIDYYKIPRKNFNHMDYLWAQGAKRLVYSRLIMLLKKGTEIENNDKHNYKNNEEEFKEKDDTSSEKNTSQYKDEIDIKNDDYIENRDKNNKDGKKKEENLHESNNNDENNESENKAMFDDNESGSVNKDENNDGKIETKYEHKIGNGSESKIDDQNTNKNYNKSKDKIEGNENKTINYESALEHKDNRHSEDEGSSNRSSEEDSREGKVVKEDTGKVKDQEIDNANKSKVEEKIYKKNKVTQKIKIKIKF